MRTAASRLLTALALAAPLICGLGFAGAADAAVVISQVYGGGGNSGATLRQDFIELFNNGTTAEAVGGWSVQYASATGSTWQVTPIPAGTSVAAGHYLLVREAQGSGGSVDVVGDLTGTLALSGSSGKVALSRQAQPLSGAAPVGSAIVDIVSYGDATPTHGSPTGVLSNTTAALRHAGGCDDSGDNGIDFDIAAPAPRNGGSAARACTGDGGGGGSPAPLAVTIPAIQGPGATSPLARETVITTGVVTLLTNNGFYLQDPVGDGDPATSDGLFVFTGSSAYAAVAVGNLVQVAGTVVEFNTGIAANADTAAHTVTELNSVTAVALLNNGQRVVPTPISLPIAVAGGLERYEGMLVTLTGPLTVQQNYFEGRFGQLTLAAGGRLETPTNRFRPGADAVALEADNAARRILLDDASSVQNPNPTPYLAADGVPRAGDRVAAITGVIDYGLATSSNAGPGGYKLQPTVAPVFLATNPRTPAPEPVGGNLKIASFNVLNFFTTFTDGSDAAGRTGQGCALGASIRAANCRGADGAAEFARQRTKIVLAMAAINADAFGLMEIQNDGNVAVQNLVDALNAQVGAGTYAAAALPAQETGNSSGTNTGTDAIRVAIVYKPAALRAVGAPASDTDPVNNRPTLAQTFELPNGERFTLFVNHLKSKGSCPAPGDADAAGNLDSGDGQGCWNLLRTAQVARLRSFVAQRQTAAGSNDALLIGDFNAYAQEDPIFGLTGNGYTDQIGRFTPAGTVGYSYVFDGASGRLDQAIASGSLSAKVTGASHWHINADEAGVRDYNLEFKAPAVCGSQLCPADPYTASPYRASDHDPVVVGLALVKEIAGSSGRDVLVGTPGDDRITGGPGADTLTGGGGNNVFVYLSLRDAGDVITDFKPGHDRIDLTALLASIGATPASAATRGVVRWTASGNDTLLQIDTDGSAGPIAPRTLVTLTNVAPAALSAARDLGIR